MTQIANTPNQAPADAIRAYVVDVEKVVAFYDLLDRARQHDLSDELALLAHRDAVQHIEQVLLHSPILRYRVR